MSGGWLRRTALALFLAVAVVGIVTARAVTEGENELVESDADFHRGDLRSSIVHARRAAVLYAPGAPHVRGALRRLEAIGVGSEARGDRETAEAAWRAERGAALEIRHLWVPHAAELERANQALARLAALGPVHGEPRPERVVTAEALSELNRDDAPRARYIVLLAIGFLLSAAGLAWVALRGVTPEGKAALGRAKLGVAVWAIGALCWTLAIYRA